MEPMSLGSPPTSPSSGNPNFLPAFLMGQNQSSTPNRPLSPGRTKTVVYKVGCTPEPKNLRQKLFNQSVNEVQFTSYNNVSMDKSGPPKQGLFDSINVNKMPTPVTNSTMQNNVEPFSFTPNESFSQIDNSLNYSNMGNISINRSQAQSNLNVTDRKETLWVTVFGFPPSAASFVIAQFSNCGIILEKHFPNQGNWVNLKYNSSHEVAKALSLNGKLISNCIMVGVMLYFNKQENKENIDELFTSPARVRSLRQSFVSPQTTGNVIQQQNVPQKSTGIVSKAMEYVFGW